MANEVEPNAIYVASRASLPERGEMWRKFRSDGVNITSSWIDEDGAGQTADWRELWERIATEIADSNESEAFRLILSELAAAREANEEVRCGCCGAMASSNCETQGRH
jgi:hypothetical protein